jgi:hypothetical protein
MFHGWMFYMAVCFTDGCIEYQNYKTLQYVSQIDVLKKIILSLGSDVEMLSCETTVNILCKLYKV